MYKPLFLLLLSLLLSFGQINQPCLLQSCLSIYFKGAHTEGPMLPSKKAETIYDLCLDAWKWEEPFSTANQCQSNTEHWLVIHSMVKKSDMCGTFQFYYRYLCYLRIN